MAEDARWKQRFGNFEKAFAKLTEAVEWMRANPSPAGDTVVKEMFREGLIQRFECTHELAWNVMKDYARYQGNPDVGGSRDATREALRIGLIADGHTWMAMIGSRNQTSHTYNEDTAEAIFDRIGDDYSAFRTFAATMREKGMER
ncbi:MAG: nucleotidyltransferase substrate binding protein [Catalinimonas sp.]